MELRDAIRTNGAVRAFTDQPVADEVLAAILDTARFAPSGGNRQAWTVLVLRDPEVRRAVRDLSAAGWREYAAHLAAGLRPFAMGPDGRWHGPGVDLAAAHDAEVPLPFVDRMHEAPVLLVVAYDLTEVAYLDIDAPYQPIMGGGSVFPFVQNVLLCARDAGLGGVLTTFLGRRAAEARGLLGLPASHAIAAVVALGYPEHRATKLTRNPVAAFARVDRFDGEPFGPGQ
ncbi:MAG: nitroreductase family protein [Acidimicrobiales bacterium]|jgi:nitroreductase|nr:nitroreductase family protein [Acidimicrobiales bacterium]